MKKFILPLLFSIAISVKADHTSGGTIYWKCLNNGQYQFYMDFYRDCSGIQFPFFGTNQTLSIFGSPLPKDSSGNVISSITMVPDTARYLTNRSGDNAPLCDTLLGTPSRCSNSLNPNANGFIQILYYKSAPITLSGTPGRIGWSFRWGAICCRPSTSNVSVANQLILESIMFPIRNRDNNPCYNSSPQFALLPQTAVCRGTEYVYNSAAIEENFDDLVYGWDTPLEGPIAAPIPVSYSPNYASNNPLPGTFFNTNNIPAKLNVNTGLINFKVVNGLGIQKYFAVVKADEYRDGILIARVKREFPIAVVDCPVLPSGQTNEVPRIFLDSVESKSLKLDVIAGEEIRIPLKFIDGDSTGVQLNTQFLTIEPFGSNFSSDLTDSTDCLIAPCPQLMNRQPQFDSLRNKFVLNGRNEINSEFIWQTECSHLNGKSSQRYRFYFQVIDDHCPLPESNIASLNINVLANPTQPIVSDCPLIIGANQLELEWGNVGIDSTEFDQWIIWRSSDSSESLVLIDSIADFKQTNYIDSVADTSTHFYQIEGRSIYCDQRLAISDTILAEDAIDIGITASNQVLSSNETDSVQYQWYDCMADTLVTDSTERFFGLNRRGSYAVILTRGDCQDTSTCFEFLPVGIKENLLQQQLRYYPNPTEGNIIIELGEKQEYLKASIRNVHGQLVNEGQYLNIHRLELNIEGGVGIYFIQLLNEQGDQANLKLLKQ